MVDIDEIKIGDLVTIDRIRAWDKINHVGEVTEIYTVPKKITYQMLFPLPFDLTQVLMDITDTTRVFRLSISDYEKVVFERKFQWVSDREVISVRKNGKFIEVKKSISKEKEGNGA